MEKRVLIFKKTFFILLCTILWLMCAKYLTRKQSVNVPLLVRETLYTLPPLRDGEKSLTSLMLGHDKLNQLISRKKPKTTQFKIREINLRPAVNSSEKRNLIPDSACSAPYLSIGAGGRLGNQVCQFMSLLFFRYKFGIRIAISPVMKTELNKIFVNISEPTSPSPCFKQTTTSCLQTNFHSMYNTIENATNFSPPPKKNPNSSYSDLKQYNLITGSPCPISYYLNEYRRQLMSKLKIQDEIRLEAELILNKTLLENSYEIFNVTLISIHVRRTDYLDYSKIYNLTLPSPQFYKNAITFYETRIPNAVFVVITDDEVWSKKNLEAKNVLFPGTADIKYPYIDYTIMALCRHHVVGKGTFGRTAAFLGGGTIVGFSGDDFELVLSPGRV